LLRQKTTQAIDAIAARQSAWRPSALMTLLIPIDSAAVSYQPNDLKSVRRAVRTRFPLSAFFGELVDLRSTFRDAMRFKFVSLEQKRSFSRRHWGIKSMQGALVKAWRRANFMTAMAFRGNATEAATAVSMATTWRAEPP
jgi:hypothetical protein